MPNNKKNKRPLHKTFFFNLGVIIVICGLLYWGLMASLSIFTRHGQSIPVPKFVDLSLPAAQQLIRENHFTLDVDSTYLPGKKPLTVIAQEPQPGFGVKEGHTISLTVNKTTASEIQMPELVNLSYRSALMLLKTNKLLLKDTIMKPDLAQGAVLEQLLNDQPIKAGTNIPQGSAITLVVGNGLGKKEMDVPDITGMSYSEATALLSGSNLNYNALFDGTITDTTSAVVYMQIPTAIDSTTGKPNKIDEGMVVNFRLRQKNQPYYYDDQ